MKAYDFTRSFMTFRIDILKKPALTVSHKPPFTLNNARIQIACRCEITDKTTGQAREYLLGESCKTERVGVEKDIWTEPNADFVPIHTRGQFLNIKTFDTAGKQVFLYPASLGVQPERQVGDSNEAFDGIRLDMYPTEGEVLKTADDIIAAVLRNQPLTGRIELEHGRYIAVLEFPVKTINAGERDHIYQTDTGPILLPDLNREPDDLIAGFELAFAALNCPTWVEFIVRAPTPIAEGIKVYHYSKSVRWDSKNQIIALK
jgi:hypothetical protein